MAESLFNKSLRLKGDKPEGFKGFNRTGGQVIRPF